MSAADALNAETLRAALGNQLIGSRIVLLEETTSTNEVAFQLAPESAEGLVVFAERQTAGRGQHGKRWESAAHRGLWFSILLRPTLPPNESSCLTAWAAQTIAVTVNDQFSLGATVKPPNDVCVDRRKVAGVLLELRAVLNSPHVAILGIGINVNQRATDFPAELREVAGSLAMLLGRPVNRQLFAMSILQNLNATYPFAEACDPALKNRAPIKSSLRDSCSRANRDRPAVRFRKV